MASCRAVASFLLTKIDVSMNSSSSGTRSLRFGKDEGVVIPGPKTDSPHISVTAFANYQAK